MKRTCSRVAVLICVFCTRAAFGIVNGQIDTFEDGTTMNWANGAGNLINMDTGGPGGANDNFLQLSANGSPAIGGRLTTFNLFQWLGNYIAAGVNAIDLDLRNQGATTLSIRLAFKTQNLMNSPGYLSQAITLAPGGGWQHFTVSLSQASLIAVGGPAAYNTFFTTGPGDARIINEAGTSTLNGDPIVGVVGIDNVHAVPEPSSVVLLVLAIGVIAAGRSARPGTSR